MKQYYVVLIRFVLGITHTDTELVDSLSTSPNSAMDQLHQAELIPLELHTALFPLPEVSVEDS
jgi:hypothetical protein